MSGDAIFAGRTMGGAEPMGIAPAVELSGGRDQGITALFLGYHRQLVGFALLLVDDLADSGVTLHAVVEMLRSNYRPITELRSAVIWTKGLSKFQPDYSVEPLPTNPWIHQPFEAYDAMRPQQLLEKWKV